MNFNLSLFESIFWSATESIIISNKQGEILISNPSACCLFGYHKEEFLQLKIESLIPSRFKVSHEKHRDAFHDNPSPRRMGAGRDLFALTKQGKEIPIEVGLSHFISEGQPLVAAFIIDITVRKEMEKKLSQSQEELVKYSEDLEAKVKERTLELEHLNLGLKQEIDEKQVIELKLINTQKEIEKALEKEKQLNELKSRFVSMASHEFRTPLSTILSSASLINKYDQQEKRLRHVNKIKKSVNNLTNILNDFLSLEKLETGKTILDMTSINVMEVNKEIMEEFEFTKKHGQYIACSHSGASSFVTDVKIYKNILFNLISNAIKYSDEDQEILFTSEVLNDEALIVKVIDRGIGIPDEDQKRLFTSFYRATNVENIQGTGLGLAIVKRYVNLLDGKVIFKSKLKEGTTFEIHLPQKN